MFRRLVTVFLLCLPVFAFAVPSQYCPSVGRYVDSTDDCGSGNDEDCCPADLSVAAYSNIATTSADGAVATDKDAGTMYACVKASGAAAPSFAEIVAGTNCVDTSSKTVSATGTVTFNSTDNFSGLTASTTYRAYYAHDWDDRPIGEVDASGTFQTSPASGGNQITDTGKYLCSTGCSDSNNGDSHTTPWCSLSKVTGLSASVDVNLCANGVWTNQKLAIAHNGTGVDPVYVRTYYVDGANAYEWILGEGNKAKLDYPQGLNSSGDEVMRVTGDDVYVTAIEINATGHSTCCGYQTRLLEADGVNDFTVDDVDLRAWATFTDAINAQTAGQSTAILVTGTSNDIVVKNSTAWNSYNFLLIGNSVSDVLADNNLSYDLFHNHYFYGGSTGDHNYNLVIQNNDIRNSYRSDGVQSFSNCVARACSKEALIRDNVFWGGSDTIAENAIDLKGAGNVAILRNIVSMVEGNNDGALDGDDRNLAGSISHGAGASNVQTDIILVRENIIFDTLSGIANYEGWTSINNTILATNRDYTGSNSTYVNVNNRIFDGIVFVTGTADGGSIRNNIMGFSNQANIEVNDWANGTVDGNFYCTDFSDDPNYTFDDQTNPEVLLTSLTDFQDEMQLDASILGDEANGAEGVCDFVTLANADPTGNYATQGYDFSLDTLSAADNWAQPQSNADGAAAGGSSTQLTVDDARAFVAKSYTIQGVVYEEKDYIKIGTGTVVQISSIDYATDVITLSAARNWADNDDVYLADANGNIFDDAGACESSWTVNRCTQ